MRSAILVTPDHPGAVAVIQLSGDVRGMLRELIAAEPPSSGRLTIQAVGGLDDVLVGCLDETSAFLMPAGGPRAVRQLLEHVREHGIDIVGPAEVDPRILYPEAGSAIEALTFAALARAASPLAIEPLLRQVEVLSKGAEIGPEVRDRSRLLNRLINPPLVVVAGRPNVGKSTLSNRLLGRPLSIAADLPGTTRDYTAARINLAGLVVNWVDTPGLRSTDDEIERHAVSIAVRLFESADLVIALSDPWTDWPALMREPNLRISNKADLASRQDAALCISAQRGDGIEELTDAIRELLVPARALHSRGPWLFDARLESMLP